MESSEYQRTMKRCFIKEIDLKILLDEFTFAIINDVHNSSNLPTFYLFLSIAVAISYWSNVAQIKDINFYNIPLILFGILCGGSGMFNNTIILILFIIYPFFVKTK